MRLRIFSISLIVGLISAILVTVLNMSYVRSVRLNMIDEQLRESATDLVNSDFADLRRNEMSDAEGIISDELGPRRIGKIFVLRNAQGEIIFQSQGAQALERELPREPQWLTVKDEDRFIRVLNLKLTKIPNRTLQLGMVLDTSLLNWDQASWRTLLYTVAVLTVIILASSLLSALVMRPFRHLRGHLENVSQELSRFHAVPAIPEDQFKFAVRRKGDEFGQLLKLLNHLIHRINEVSAMTKLWSARLAHELKTPMTILRLEADELLKEPAQKKIFLEPIDRMSKMIFDFLNWAETGSEPSVTPLPVVSCSRACESVMEQLQKVSQGRLILEIKTEREVRALPEHVEIVIRNLAENALKYSPPGRPVLISLDATELVVRDEGEGIPAKVKAHLGTPFNRGAERGSESSSSGIGLALVESVCRRYDWAFESEISEGFHRCRIRF